MEAMNAVNSQDNDDVTTEAFFVILNLLEPIIPHVANELSDRLFGRANFGEIKLVEEAFEKDSLNLGVTVNGKRRGEIEVSVDTSEAEILHLAKQNVGKWIEGKEIVKEIYIAGKLVNLVIKG